MLHCVPRGKGWDWQGPGAKVRGQGVEGQGEGGLELLLRRAGLGEAG